MRQGIPIALSKTDANGQLIKTESENRERRGGTAAFRLANYLAALAFSDCVSRAPKRNLINPLPEAVAAAVRILVGPCFVLGAERSTFSATLRACARVILPVFPKVLIVLVAMSEDSSVQNFLTWEARFLNSFRDSIALPANPPLTRLG